MLGAPLEIFKRVLKRTFADLEEQRIDQNIQAAQYGYESVKDLRFESAWQWEPGSPKGRLMDDGYYHRFYPQEIVWAPDARHTAMFIWELKWSPGRRKWIVTFEGLVTVDFYQFLEADPADLPMVPDYVKVVDNEVGGAVCCPCFQKSGSQLWFTRPITSSLSDLQYIELEDYLPVNNGQRTTFLSDGTYNVTSGLFPKPGPEFFPSPP